MSVAAAKGAVSTQQQQATQEQIRLAQLIEDKSHNQPEVQETIRKILEVVQTSNQEEAQVALFDCDYDCEKAVALLMEKGHEVSVGWRTATNHKVTKKQQHKGGSTKTNAPEELDENGQQRGNDGPTYRNKSRGGRSKGQQQQQNGADTQNAYSHVKNDNVVSQQQQRGSNTYRGRQRGNNRGSYRGGDRNHFQKHQQQQPNPQDFNDDSSSPSDTNRRNRGTANASRQQPDQWDVGNWNGQTLIYSRTTKDDEQAIKSDDPTTNTNGKPDVSSQQKSKTDFDLIEAARQIKSCIGVGQTSKPSLSDQQQKPKSAGPMPNTKSTPPPPLPSQTQTRIPQQAVIFSDRFDGGVNKIDVQFGNLSESFEEPAATYYHHSAEHMPSNKLTQRTMEQPAHISRAPHLAEQVMMNQTRMLSTQLQQQPSMTMKQVVPPQYAMHQAQHQMTQQNIHLPSLLVHPQTESMGLDTPYDPTAFQIQPIDFNTTYFMPAPVNPSPQQQSQAHYLVSQSTLPQTTSTKSVSTVSVPTTATTTKKAPAVPPGILPPNVQPIPPGAFSTAYSVQQLTGGATYPTPYDAEHLLTNVFMPLNNTQQAPSTSGAYGSVTPPVQPQTQQQKTLTGNDNKATSGYRVPLTEGLMLIQQYQQFARQQSNSQQQGQQPGVHSSAQLNYYLTHPNNTATFSSGAPIMYADPVTAMAQQQASKQQGQQYNPNNSATGLGHNDDYYGHGQSSGKEGQYRYPGAAQNQHVPNQSAGQQQGVNKQQQQRNTGNVYSKQQGQQRPYQ